MGRVKRKKSKAARAAQTAQARLACRAGGPANDPVLGPRPSDISAGWAKRAKLLSSDSQVMLYEHLSQYSISEMKAVRRKLEAPGFNLIARRSILLLFRSAFDWAADKFLGLDLKLKESGTFDDLLLLANSGWDTLRTVATKAKESMLEPSEWVKTFAEKHHIDLNNISNMSTEARTELTGFVSNVAGLCGLRLVPLAHSNDPTTEKYESLAEKVEKQTDKFLYIPEARNNNEPSERTMSRRVALLREFLEKAQKGSGVDLLCEYIIKHKLEDEIIRKIAPDFEQHTFSAWDMLVLQKEHPRVPDTVFDMMHKAAPDIFPTLYAVNQLKTQRYSRIVIGRRTTRNGKLLARFIDIKDGLDHQIRGALSKVKTKEKVLHVEIAIGADGFSIYSAFPAFLPPGIPLEGTKRWHASVNLTSVWYYDKDGKRIVVFTRKRHNSWKNVTPLIIAHEAESYVLFQKLMSDWNTIIQQYSTEGVEIDGRKVIVTFRFNGDNPCHRLTMGLPAGANSKWISQWSTLDSVFARILHRVVNQDDYRRCLGVAWMDGKVAQWIQTKGLTLERLEQAYLDTLKEFSHDPNLSATPQMVLWNRYIADLKAMCIPRTAILLIHKKAAQNEDAMDVDEDSTDEVNASYPDGVPLDENVVVQDDDICEDPTNLTPDNVMSDVLPRSHLTYILGKLSGQIAVPVLKVEHWAGPPPSFHADERTGTALRDLVATMSSLGGTLQTTLKEFEEQGLTKCTGVMQGNHVRLLFRKLPSLLRHLESIEKGAEVIQVLGIYSAIRKEIRNRAATPEQLADLKDLCLHFGLTMNRCFPSVLWRNYTVILVHTIFHFIDSGIPLDLGDEDWVEMEIQAIKQLPTSNGGGMQNGDFSKEPSCQVIRQQLLTSDIALTSGKVAKMYEKQETHCHGCTEGGHNIRTCIADTVRYYDLLLKTRKTSISNIPVERI